MRTEEGRPGSDTLCFRSHSGGETVTSLHLYTKRGMCSPRGTATSQQHFQIVEGAAHLLLNSCFCLILPLWPQVGKPQHRETAWTPASQCLSQSPQVPWVRLSSPSAPMKSGHGSLLSRNISTKRQVTGLPSRGDDWV